jgi:hypothetical protein
VTVDHETYEQLRHAQALLGHSVPSGDVAEVLKRALGLLVHDLERRKLAKSERPRLEFDHIEAFARGGQATVSGIRLRCRAHNQFAAECTFGPEFMRGKRERSRDRAAHAPALPTSTA